MSNLTKRLSRLGCWLAIILFIIASLVSPGSARSVEGLSIQATITPAAPVIVEDPALTPVYDTLCTSHWYQIQNDRGHNAYLTLNVKNPANSENQGEWRPTLPQDGYYRVEAYIPDHGTIDWICPNFQRTVSSDTYDARYVITHANGKTTVAANQAPFNNEWLSLGEFQFRAGATGSVLLTDLNGETDFSHTIAFSALRFTWTRPPALSLHLPAISRNAG
ncbi:MAG: hypothetical protein EHM70_14920, partial [Chloroflexota bacterium]